MKKSMVVLIASIAVIFFSCEKKQVEASASSESFEKMNAQQVVLAGKNDAASVVLQETTVPKWVQKIEEKHADVVRLYDKRAKIKKKHGVNSEEYREVNVKYQKAYADLGILLTTERRAVGTIVSNAIEEYDSHI